jgi:hypothetical protein
VKKNLTPEQKAHAEERRRNFRGLAKQLADMPESDRAILAAKLPGIATVEGHSLSLTNMLLCVMQRPSITLVGGFNQWRQHGRAVRKGEHGLAIWVPSSRLQKADGAEQARAVPDPDSMNFFMGTVFDVAQTEELQGVPK